MKEELLIRYIAGECTDTEVQQVIDWTGKDPENQKRLDALRFIWDSTAALKHHSGIEPLDSLERLKSKAAKQKKKPTVFKLPFSLKIAALFILISSTTLLLFNHFYGKNIEMLSASTKNGTSEMLLEDGSLVTLNKNSLLDYPQRFTGGKRIVQLKQGEAFFKVSHDTKKPFLIRTRIVTIQVVGTSFNVKLTKGNTEVIVETGKVIVSSAQKNQTLLPGQKLVLDQHGKILERGHTDLLYQYYRSHEFAANNTPLWRMVEVLNEAYQVNIVIRDEAIRKLPLNTTFKNESLDTILNIIVKTFQLKMERNGDQIYLNK